MGKPLIIIWWLLMLCPPSSCLAAEVILVVNPGNTLSIISERTVARIFLGKTTEWPQQGGHIHVVVNNDPCLYPLFCQEILKKTALQYLLYRKKLLFTGSGIPPLTMANDEAVKDYVAATPNAIGFIQARSLDARVRQLFIR